MRHGSKLAALFFVLLLHGQAQARETYETCIHNMCGPSTTVFSTPKKCESYRDYMGDDWTQCVVSDKRPQNKWETCVPHQCEQTRQEFRTLNQCRGYADVRRGNHKLCTKPGGPGGTDHLFGGSFERP